MNRALIITGALASLGLYVSLGLAEDQPTGQADAAGRVAQREAGQELGVWNEIRATMAALRAAQSANEPDEDTIAQLTDELQWLRTLHCAQRRGSGLGSGRGPGYGGGRGPGYGLGRGPGRGMGAGLGRGPGYGRGRGAGWGPGFVDENNDGICDRY